MYTFTNFLLLIHSFGSYPFPIGESKPPHRKSSTFKPLPGAYLIYVTQPTAGACFQLHLLISRFLFQTEKKWWINIYIYKQ